MKNLAKFVVVLAMLSSGAVFAQSYSSSGLQDNSTHTRPQELSIMAYFPWYFGGLGIGVTARYAIPVLPDGFINGINDSFEIEPGLAFEYASNSVTVFGTTYGYSWTSIAPYVQGTWSLHFSKEFRAYAGLALGARIVVANNSYGSYGGASGLLWDPVVGIYYNFAPNMALRAELGYEGPKAGLAFAF